MYKIIILLILSAIIAYISALLSYPFIYILSFAFLCYSSILIILQVGWGVFRKVANKSNNKKLLDFVSKIEILNKWKCFLTFILAIACLMLFVYGRMAINRHYMPHSLSIVRVSFKILLLITTLGLFCGYVKSKKKTVPIVCTVLYILFIIFAPLFALFRGAGAINGDASEESLTNILRTLPYVGWAPVESTEKVSVTVHDPNKAFDGYNIYSPRNPYTHLIDMEGNLIHTWQTNLQGDIRIYAQMLDNGDLLTFAIDKRFVKLDWDSNVLWESNLRTHHDFHISGNGNIYTLARKDSIVFYKGMPFPILEDYIAVLSSGGKLLKNINIFESIEDEYSWGNILDIYKEILKPKTIFDIISKKITGRHLFEHDLFGDIMHVNTVELLERDVPGLGSKDDILLSIREIDLIGVLDTGKNRLVWKWGPGEISKQHRPTLLGNNNILLFDNGYDVGFSQILEIDPIDKTIVWSYNSDGSENFYTARSGGGQRLPNDNILISQAQTGRIFEITRDGEIVWEYFNPNVDKETSKRQTIFVMERLALPEEVLEKIQ